VIEVYELPVRGLRNLGVVKLHRIAPDRQKMLVVTLLQSGSELVEGHAQVDCRLVDAGDRDGAALRGLRGMDGCHGILASHGNDRLRIAQFKITIYSCIDPDQLFLAEGLQRPTAPSTVARIGSGTAPRARRDDSRGGCLSI